MREKRPPSTLDEGSFHISETPSDDRAWSFHAPGAIVGTPQQIV